ncbi:MAG: preprotein translocase subunit SecY [Candidatus Magasanikbacteria bacterium]
MLETIKKVWKIEDIRNKILFILAMLLIFRAVAHIPIPGVNTQALSNFLQSNQIFGLLNMFSGGTVENFSVAMLGVAPYITASIIFQMLQKTVPALEKLQKEEGEQGQKKINMYTRFATLPLALIQAFGFIQMLSRSGQGIVTTTGVFSMLGMAVIAASGTMFLMWIGELISEKNIGNGISLLIFAGIIASAPQAVKDAIINYNPADLNIYVMFLVVAIITIVGVVFITQGQRNIPINYASQARGPEGEAGPKNYLPLKVNTAGVIPIIFAISIVLFPPTVGQMFVDYPGFIGSFAQFIVNIFQNQLFYGIIYFILVFGFTYFYTAIIFHPKDIAENLQKQGAFIPGVRPGKPTEKYIAKTMNRLVFSGALFLGLIAILPLIMQAFTGSQTLAIGGTSLLIVVQVAIRVAKKIKAQLTLHEYEQI